MTDEQPELTPAYSERVRRLLADARHTGPVPDDVAARLDRTLASLADERRDQRTVVSLGSRRRRTVTRLLVAAAAVVAVGVGLGQVLTGVESGDDSAGSTASFDDSPSSRDERAPQPAEQPEAGADARIPPPRVDDGTFDADVLAARERRTTATEDLGSLGGEACERSAWGDGRRVAVRYDGGPAVLVFREAAAGVQAVDLFRCGVDAPLRSTEVPAS